MKPAVSKLVWGLARHAETKSLCRKKSFKAYKDSRSSEKLPPPSVFFGDREAAFGGILGVLGAA